MTKKIQTSKGEYDYDKVSPIFEGRSSVYFYALEESVPVAEILNPNCDWSTYDPELTEAVRKLPAEDYSVSCQCGGYQVAIHVSANSDEDAVSAAKEVISCALLTDLATTGVQILDEFPGTEPFPSESIPEAWSYFPHQLL